MGGFKLDPAEYPDPHEMMRELDELAIRLMVSVWPTISPARKLNGILRGRLARWQRPGR